MTSDSSPMGRVQSDAAMLRSRPIVTLEEGRPAILKALDGVVRAWHGMVLNDAYPVPAEYPPEELLSVLLDESSAVGDSDTHCHGIDFHDRGGRFFLRTSTVAGGRPTKGRFHDVDQGSLNILAGTVAKNVVPYEGGSTVMFGSQQRLLPVHDLIMTYALLRDWYLRRTTRYLHPEPPDFEDNAADIEWKNQCAEAERHGVLPLLHYARDHGLMEGGVDPNAPQLFENVEDTLPPELKPGVLADCQVAGIIAAVENAMERRVCGTVDELRRAAEDAESSVYGFVDPHPDLEVVEVVPDKVRWPYIADEREVSDQGRADGGKVEVGHVHYGYFGVPSIPGGRIPLHCPLPLAYLLHLADWDPPVVVHGMSELQRAFRIVF